MKITKLGLLLSLLVTTVATWAGQVTLHNSSHDQAITIAYQFAYYSPGQAVKLSSKLKTTLSASEDKSIEIPRFPAQQSGLIITAVKSSLPHAAWHELPSFVSDFASQQHGCWASISGLHRYSKLSIGVSVYEHLGQEHGHITCSQQSK